MPCSYKIIVVSKFELFFTPYSNVVPLLALWKQRQFNYQISCFDIVQCDRIEGANEREPWDGMLLYDIGVFSMQIIIVIVLGILNIPIYRWSFKRIFGSKEVFYECLKYDFTPDFISLFRGELLKDMAAEYRLSGFVLLNVIVFMTEYYLVTRLLGAIGLQT